MIVERNYFEPQKSKDFETKKFGIADMSIVIELLTKLYSNPKKTLTQEYICNARDANREVNSKTPIKIVAPTKLSPTMRIRDYGPGLDPDRIENVFLFYGASTKTMDNSQTGGFGIGAKSAWAYTDVFTITTFVGGKKRTYIAHKSKGCGNLDLISTEDTEEPNGTEISIGINPADIYVFQRAILTTVAFWKDEEFPTLCGMGEEVKKGEWRKFYKEIFNGFAIFPDGQPSFFYDQATGPLVFTLRAGRYVTRNLFVVDGIPFDISQISGSVPQLSGLKVGYAMFFETGELKIAPTREGIVSDEGNIKAISARIESANSGISKYIEDKLKKHKKTYDKLKEYAELYNNFSVTPVCIDGYRIYDGFFINDSLCGVQRFGTSYTGAMRRNITTVVPMSLDNTFCYSINESAEKRNYRVRKVFENSGAIDVYVIQKPKPTRKKKDGSEKNEVSLEFYEKLIKDLNLKDLADVDTSGFVEKTKTKVKRIAKTVVNLFKWDGYAVEQKEIDVDQHTDIVVYMSKEYFSRRGSYDIVDFARYAKSIGVDFGYLAETYIKKAKDKPNFVTYFDFKGSHVPFKDTIKRLAANDATANCRRISNAYSNFDKLNLDGIFDKRFTKISQPSCETLVNIPYYFRERANKTDLYKKVYKEVEDFWENIDALISEYPLLKKYMSFGELNELEAGHMVKYINMVYKEKDNV